MGASLFLYSLVGDRPLPYSRRMYEEGSGFCFLDLPNSYLDIKLFIRASCLIHSSDGGVLPGFERSSIDAQGTDAQSALFDSPFDVP